LDTNTVGCATFRAGDKAPNRVSLHESRASTPPHPRTSRVCVCCSSTERCCWYESVQATTKRPSAITETSLNRIIRAWSRTDRNCPLLCSITYVDGEGCHAEATQRRNLGVRQILTAEFGSPPDTDSLRSSRLADCVRQVPAAWRCWRRCAGPRRGWSGWCYACALRRPAKSESPMARVVMGTRRSHDSGACRST
jgi:hypothetical protein